MLPALLSGYLTFASLSRASIWNSSSLVIRHDSATACDQTNSSKAFTPAESVWKETAGGGVLTSGDAGGSWTPASSGLAHSFVYALAADPHSASTLYAATFKGISKSTDGGATWQTASSGLAGSAVAIGEPPFASPSTSGR